jgi:hypothetical protein
MNEGVGHVFSLSRYKDIITISFATEVALDLFVDFLLPLPDHRLAVYCGARHDPLDQHYGHHVVADQLGGATLIQ